MWWKTGSLTKPIMRFVRRMEVVREYSLTTAFILCTIGTRRSKVQLEGCYHFHTVLRSNDVCKMFLHSFQEDTNARTSCIRRHPVVSCGYQKHPSSRVKVRRVQIMAHYKCGCQKIRRISDNYRLSDELYGWLVIDLFSHHTNHLVNQAGLVTVTG